jgi:hypothetical protein
MMSVEKLFDQSRKPRQQCRTKDLATNKSVSDAELLEPKIDALARKIGEMDPEDPKRHEYVNELCALGLRASIRSQTASDQL